MSDITSSSRFQRIIAEAPSTEYSNRSTAVIRQSDRGQPRCSASVSAPPATLRRNSVGRDGVVKLGH
jgi:hypothetical protein